eukprot:873428-Prorocentrum_minimum.AAC.1
MQIQIRSIASQFQLELRFQLEFGSLTLPGLARRSDKPSAARASSGRRPQGGRWEEAAHRQGRNLEFGI